MALSTYAELLTAIAAWVKPNTTLTAAETALIPDYVKLFEAKANKILMAPEMLSEEALTITNGSATTPTGLLNVQRIQLTESPYTVLAPVDIDLLNAAQGFNTGSPKAYARIGTTIKTDSYDSKSAYIRFRKALTALSSGVNWLYTYHPDLYLFGSVIEADVRFVDPEQLELAKDRFDTGMELLNRMNQLEHMGSYQMRPSGAVA